MRNHSWDDYCYGTCDVMVSYSHCGSSLILHVKSEEDLAVWEMLDDVIMVSQHACSHD